MCKFMAEQQHSSKCSSSSESLKHLTDAQKRHRRLCRNREFAKEARNRNKAREEYLELQVKQLTEEANQLKAEQETLKPALLASAFQRDRAVFQAKLAEMLQNPQTTEAELNTLIDGTKDKLCVGERLHSESLQEAFNRTVDMMIPEQVVVSLMMGQENALPEFEALVQSSLSANLIARFRDAQMHFREETPGLKEALNRFKSAADGLRQHVQTFESLLLSLRPILSARQCALWSLWLNKYETCLSSEKVLNYGRNSMELLNAS